MSINRPDVNAKQMFFVGLLGLPWLWIVNVMYHWRAVYGKSDSTSQNDSNNENQGILAMMSTDDDDNEGDGNEEISPELIQAELAKWIKRSTAGSFLSVTVFITWIVVFQLNRDSFGPKWFVMSQEEGERTGW